jgi:prolyl 4-hydroxylase
MSTAHCLHCHMPLFAQRFDDQKAQSRPELAGRFIAPDILLVDEAFDASAALIQQAETVAMWRSSSVSQDGKVETKDTRTNAFVHLAREEHPDFTNFQEQVTRIAHAGAALFMNSARHLRLRSDLGFQILRYGPSDEFTEHADLECGAATVYGSRLLSAILYLNDNYEGGELEFPRQECVYNPQAGSMVLFPSSFTHPHLSRPITKGTKYAAVTWFI